MPHLVLAKASASCHLVEPDLTARGAWKWIYAGQDSRGLARWRKGLEPEVTLEDTGPALQRAAEDLRSDFGRFIDELGRRYNSLGWWLGSIGEKNPYVSPLFLQLCYLHMVFETAQQYPDANFLIVAESDGLRRSIARNARNRGFVVVDRTPRRHDTWWPFRYSATRLAAKARYLLKLLGFLRRLRRASAGERTPGDASEEQKDLVLLHSWILDGSFTQDGQYRDLYFDGLPGWHEQQGRRVRYLVMPATLMLDRVRPDHVLSSLARTGRLFPVGKWLKRRDILAATWLPLWICRFPRGRVFCHGWDLSGLIAEERLVQRWANRTTDTYLYYVLAKRLGAERVALSQLVYPFENHIWEKALCMGARESGLRAELVGYQHASIPAACQNFFPGPFEISSGVLPDRLVCCGKRWAETLARQGYPRIEVGPALRYGHLWSPGDRCPHDKPTILVSLSAGGDGLELVWKSFHAFKSDESKRIVLKPHPSMPLTVAQIESFLGEELPSHFEIATGPLPPLLAVSDLVVYTSSAVCFEALARGIPVLCLEQSLDIDKDLLRFMPELRLAARTSKELSECAERLISEDDSQRSRRMDSTRRVIRDVFEPISEDSMEVFTPRGPRAAS